MDGVGGGGGGGGGDFRESWGMSEIMFAILHTI